MTMFGTVSYRRNQELNNIQSNTSFSSLDIRNYSYLIKRILFFRVSSINVPLNEWLQVDSYRVGIFVIFLVPR